MAKYIVKPGERVTHGSYADANEHREKMGKLMPGQSIAVWPASPARDYFEGEEIELTEDEAAAMPHAVCTPDEWDELASPTAFMKKGYSKDEAESMAVSMREGIKARAEQRAKRASRAPIGGGMAPTDGSTEPNPRAAGKFADELPKKPQK